MERIALGLLIGFQLVFLSGEDVFSQVLASENYVVTQFGLDEGLPQSSINDIIQTRDGYIWLATFGGLVRFDGFSFTTYNRSNTKGMNYDRVISLYEDRESNIWMRTEEGVVKFKDGVATSFSIFEKAGTFISTSIQEDEEDRVWITINDQPYIYQNDQFRLYSDRIHKKEPGQILNEFPGVWLSLGKKIVKSQADTLIEVLDLSSKIQNTIVDFIEYPENSGVFFIATSGNGVIKYDQSELIFLDEKNGLPTKDVWKFYIDKNKRLWLSAFGGLTWWDGESFQPFDVIKPSGNIDLQLASMLEDNEGNLWMGSSAEGLFKVQTTNITMIDNQDGLFNQKMLSLTELANGTYLFATNCGGVYEFKEGKVTAAYINAFLPNQCIWSVSEDSKGRIWFGSQGLYRTESFGRKGEVIDNRQGFEGVNIFAIKEASNGDIWIGCSNGIFKFNGSGFINYTATDGQPFPETRTFFEDNKGRIWAGTVSGVFRIKDEKIDQVILSDIKEERDSSDEPYIRAIHEDEDGVMWLGSYGNGIYRLEGEEVFNITQSHGLFDNIVSHIIEDENGNFWMGSNRGISRVSRNQLNQLSSGEVNHLVSYSYGTGDGMNSTETNGGFYPNSITNEYGEIFLPTVRGIAVISVNNLTSHKPAPNVYIENLRVSDGEVPVSESITLPYNNSFLEVRYTGLSFTAPEKTEFRYRLSGLNNDWIEVGNRREALYSKIPPGSYTFNVSARNSKGDWNEQVAKLGIVVVPPYWQRSWFIILTFGLVTGGVFFIFYSRASRLKKENEQKRHFTTQLIESQENERKRIAAELHDGLGQQILVIKNRVELAKHLVERGSELEKQLDEIRHSTARSIEDVRTISHDLRPVILEKFGLTDAVTNLCEELEEATDIDWSYHIDNIDKVFLTNKEIIFYRILQEGINNILKHSKALQASLIVQHVNDRILVTLYDDGIGFNTNFQENMSSGLGLMGMKERIEILNGELNVQSKPESGTTVKIRIPIERFEEQN